MYELQTMKSSFPILFHTDILFGISRPHWHENIEILHLTSGNAKIVVDSQEIEWNVGDTIIVNTNAIHQFFALEKQIEYHCLIINIEFLQQMGINMNENYIKTKICSEEITGLFNRIKQISIEKNPYYEPEMCSEALKIATFLIRNYPSEKGWGIDFRNSAKYSMIKNAITFMKKNFSASITLDDISNYIGFTKCYFCRTFKEATGITVIQMLNLLRCNEAKRLFLTTERSVSEIALACGYSNFSHFTKTYKSIIGCMPSETKKTFL